MEKLQTNLAFFGEASELNLNEIESDFFSRRPETDLSLYALFTAEDRELMSDKRLIPELREKVFDSIARLYRNVNLLMNDSMTSMFRREQMYNYLQEKIKGKTDDEIRELPLTIAAADFAGLGYFNQQSHDAGDLAIKVATTSMKKSMDKETGLAFRSGGDEFSFVIKKRKGEATQIGEKMRERLMQIDTSDSSKMDGYSFELPLRVDIGYADLSEGIAVYSDICSKMPDDKICISQVRENSIVDLTYQIADQRAMLRKGISLIQFLVSKYEENPDTEYFKNIFAKATLKKPISYDDFVKIALIKDKSEQVKMIMQKGFELSHQEVADKERDAVLKQSIIKDKAEEQIKNIIN